MERKNIPGTDLSVSPVCFGGSFVELTEKEEAFRMLDLFAEVGGNFYDMGNVYGRWLPHGLNSGEMILGEWLRRRGGTGDLVIATKGGHPDMKTMHIPRLSREDFETDVNSSLTTLGLEQIPLYYIHRDCRDLPVEHFVETMNEFVRQGKIRYWGVSNWTHQRIEQANAYAEDHGLQGICVNQPMWSLALPQMEKHYDQTMVAMDGAMFRSHMESRMPVIPFSSQAQGYLTKLFHNPEKAHSMVIYDCEDNRACALRAKELADAHHCTVNQIAVAYLLAQDFLTIPIVGCKTEKTIYDTVGAIDIHLTAAERDYLRIME